MFCFMAYYYLFFIYWMQLLIIILYLLNATAYYLFIIYWVQLLSIYLLFIECNCLLFIIYWVQLFIIYLLFIGYSCLQSKNYFSILKNVRTPLNSKITMQFTKVIAHDHYYQICKNNFITRPRIFSCHYWLRLF